MKKQELCILALLLAMQTALIGAQTAEKPAPRFTLTIRFFHMVGTPIRPGKLVVTETNTSREPISEANCLEFRDVFHVSVRLDGRPLQERDAAARKKWEENAPCRRDATGWTIQPGESATRYVGWDYPMTEPGTYEFAVSRDSDLEHPEKGVTVPSNTLTFAVPEPDAEDPK